MTTDALEILKRMMLETMTEDEFNLRIKKARQQGDREEYLWNNRNIQRNTRRLKRNKIRQNKWLLQNR